MERTDGHLIIHPAEPLLPPRGSLGRTAARPLDRPLRREVTLPGEVKHSNPELHPRTPKPPPPTQSCKQDGN